MCVSVCMIVCQLLTNKDSYKRLRCRFLVRNNASPISDSAGPGPCDIDIDFLSENGTFGYIREGGLNQ